MCVFRFPQSRMVSKQQDENSGFTANFQIECTAECSEQIR